jgi:hypothetical protein
MPGGHLAGCRPGTGLHRPATVEESTTTRVYCSWYILFIEYQSPDAVEAFSDMCSASAGCPFPFWPYATAQCPELQVH